MALTSDQPDHTLEKPLDASLPPDIEVEVEEDVEHFHFRIGKNLTRRIDQYLTDRISYLSRSGVQRLIDEGLVKVNGRIIKASYHPREGDEIGWSPRRSRSMS